MKASPTSERKLATAIWWLALGYFVFYIPYSALVKALSSGLLQEPGMISPATNVSGLEILPAVLIGTVITMPVILFSLGWYRYMGRARLFGYNVPLPSPWAACSGIAFSIIIVTTTLAYTFQGVSIIFALLLMRGGVLIMSPLIDRFFSRPVNWYSWLGFGFSILTLAISIILLPDYTVTGLVLLNLCAYLLAYMIRLQFMTRCAKDIDAAVNRRFFVEETSVAMLALILIPGLIALFQIGRSGAALHTGFTTFLTTELVWPALIIGIFYGCLAIFGSLIYLNRRENTFVIPVNRCSSLLSGVVASAILYTWFSGDPINIAQLLGLVLIVAALVLMSFFDTLHYRKNGNWFHQRIFLFICDHNRVRSPMASAICNDHFARLLGLPADQLPRSVIVAKSAGLNLPENLKIHDAANAALKTLGIESPAHQARIVNSYDIHRSERILCMTADQKQQLIKRYPWAATKINSLGIETDAHGPESSADDRFIEIGNSLQRKIAASIRSLDPGLSM